MGLSHLHLVTSLPHSIDHHKILPGILFLLYYFSVQYTYFTSRIKFRILGLAFDIFRDLHLRTDLFQLKWYTCHLWNKPCTFLSVDLCSWQLVAWNSCPSFSSFFFFFFSLSKLIPNISYSTKTSLITNISSLLSLYCYSSIYCIICMASLIVYFTGRYLYFN